MTISADLKTFFKSIVLLMIMGLVLSAVSDLYAGQEKNKNGYIFKGNRTKETKSRIKKKIKKESVSDLVEHIKKKRAGN